MSTGNETDEISDNSFIESAANALVEIDPRARARDQIRDSDKLLHELLFPMAFPWAHPYHNEQLHKVTDLEEMPAILAAGNSTPDYKVHGEFGHLRSSRAPKTTQVAARRSNDPGVVEFTSFFKPSQAQRHFTCVQRRFDRSEDDPSLPGELSLRMYKEVHERKRKRQLFEQANKKTKLVSFRMGSTSSRSSIFDDVEVSENKLLLLPANCPKSLQEGTRLSGPKAFQKALDLGSYNIRPIPPQALASNDTSSKNRIFVGRTRLIWSEKDESQSSSHRVPYRSLLTGDRLDGPASKRPLRVKVAVRLNGVLLTSKEASARKTAALLDSALVGDGLFSYSNKVITSALDAACDVGVSVDGDHPQCSLNTEIFLQQVSRQLLSADEATASNLLSRTRQQLPIQRQSTGQLRVIPPCIDCVPSEDGIFNVVCTNSGEFIWGSIANGANVKSKHSVCTLLMRELASEYECCRYVTSAPVCLNFSIHSTHFLIFLSTSLLHFSICWKRESPHTDVGCWTKCKSCSARVHTSCLSNMDGHWECQVCATEFLEAEHFCRICNHSAGELVQNEDGSWVHEICRTWCSDCRLSGASSTPAPDADDMRCHLCSENTDAVARCAAANCNIQFHPMCAVIATFSAYEHHDNMLERDAKERDAFLCSQHELSMLQTSCCGGGTPSAGTSTALPIAFCGFHNPNRQEDFYGLYPGGAFFDCGALRVPSNRTR